MLSRRGVTERPGRLFYTIGALLGVPSGDHFCINSTSFEHIFRMRSQLIFWWLLGGFGKLFEVIFNQTVSNADCWIICVPCRREHPNHGLRRSRIIKKTIWKRYSQHDLFQTHFVMILAPFGRSFDSREWSKNMYFLRLFYCSPGVHMSLDPPPQKTGSSPWASGSGR
jgi:hypothetical protein